jgi:hypothetical protein
MKTFDSYVYPMTNEANNIFRQKGLKYRFEAILLRVGKTINHNYL